MVMASARNHQGILARLFPTGMRRRWWMFRLIDLIVALCPSRRPKSGLLVVRMDGLGDMALFRQALDHYPAAFNVPVEEITILGCRSWAPLAADIFKGFRVVALDEVVFEKRFFYRLKWALWVKRQGFKTAVCDMFFRKTLTADSLVHMSAADERIVCRPYISDKTESEFAYFLGLADRVIDTGPHPLHETLRHYNFLNEVGAPSRFALEPPHLPWRDRLPPHPVRGEEGDAPYVLFNFGSNEPGRKWPFTRFLDMAERVRERGYRVVFAGGPREKNESAQVDARFGADPLVINMVGRDTLPQLLDMIRHAHAILTTETGPGHFACVMGAPTLMICGGGHDITFVPFPDEIRPQTAHFINYPMECYHCLWRCPLRAGPKDSFPCVANITQDAVWEEFEKLVPVR